MKTFLCLLLFLFTYPVNASLLTYYFYQGGYDEGAYVIGSFSGTGSSALTTFRHQIISFTMSFSGNNLVPSFSLNFDDLDYLVYIIDGSLLLGDGPDEVISATNNEFIYEAGFLVNLYTCTELWRKLGRGETGPCGWVWDISSDDDLSSISSRTNELVTISLEPIIIVDDDDPIPAPEPSPVALLAVGLLSLFCFKKKHAISPNKWGKEEGSK